VQPREGPVPDLYAISTDRGGFSTLNQTSFPGVTSPLFGLGMRFTGGLTYDHGSGSFFAIAKDSNGVGTLYRILLDRTIQGLFPVGTGFTGGLTVRASDGTLFAIASDPSGFSSIYRISLDGSVQRLFGIAYRAAGGLVHDPSTGFFYALAEDATGFFSIYRISLSGAVHRLFGVGYGFRGGLAFHPGRRLFYAVSTDASRWSALSTISFGGVVRRRFGVGVGFDSVGLTAAPEIPGESLWFHAPLANERFVTGERIYLDGSATLGSTAGYTYPDGSALQWTSDRDGPIGAGPAFSTGLSVGTHALTLSGYGMGATRQIRVFANLADFYRARPANDEMARLGDDFAFRWLDGAMPDQQWAMYENDPFDPTSTRPSKIAALAKLDVLRHTRFSQPIPIAGGRSLYDHVRMYTRTIVFRLDPGISSAGGGTQSLARGFSQWTQLPGGDPVWTPHPYVYNLHLLVHENRHNEPGDPTHTSCQSWANPGAGLLHGQDRTFEGGSGRTAGAMYLMWVFRYGVADPANMKTLARDLAVQSLRTDFCSKPTHSDPTVQAILDQLIP
jgi:hypothetical protein